MAEKALPFAALVVLHLLSSAQRQQPIIMADEVGYLGIARYLSGTAPLPDMAGSRFYHFGYSLLLLPAFWLFTDPVSSYKAALAINALLMSALYFPLCSILESSGGVSRPMVRWIAFTCALYPPLLLYSSFAWSENAFVLFFALTVAVFGRYLVTQTAGRALLLGSLVGFLYTIHPRALPVLVIVVVYLATLAWLRVVPRRQAALSTMAVGLVFSLTRVLNEHLKGIGWGGSGEFSAAALGGRLLPGRDLALVIERVCGQLLYLAQASHGLALLGLAGAIWLILGKARSESPRRAMADPGTAVPTFALLGAAGVFVASVASKLYGIHGWAGIRPTALIHGRYNEALAVVFVALALALLSRRDHPRPRRAGGALVVIVVILGLTVVVATELVDAQQRQAGGVSAPPSEHVVLPSAVRGTHVAGVYPLVRFLGELNLYRMSAVAIAAFLLLITAMRYSRRAGLLLLMTAFVSFAVDNFRQQVLPREVKARPRLAFASQISRLGPIDSISYDDAHFEVEVFYGLQYLLPRTRFRRFHSGRGERPDSEAVVSANRWGQARRLGARYVVSSGWDNALWALPGELQSRLTDPSYEGVVLGVEPLLGIAEFGFDLPEVFGGAPGRWTRPVATLRVPVNPRRPPRVLGIETLVLGPDGAQLELRANGVVLWDGRIPPQTWSQTFRLDRIPAGRELLIKLKSDSSSAGSGRGSVAARPRGVILRGVRLTASDRLVVPYEGVTLGAERVLGFEDSGFHLPESFEGARGRWTDGAATLRVPLSPDDRPRRLAIETVAPGRDGAHLRILANGVELWQGWIPAAPWSETFRLDTIPLDDELLIELESDTLRPSESQEGSGDTRGLGVVVRAIRLTAGQDFDDAARRGGDDG